METASIPFIIFLIAAIAIAFFVLKKTVKMAIRALVVGLILLIAVVGGASLWWFGGADKPVENRVAPVKKVR